MLNFRKTLLFCSIIVGFLSVYPTRAEAIVLDKSTYYIGEPVIAADGGGPLVLYKLDDNDIPIGQVPNYSPDWDVNYLGLSVGHYSLMEFDVDTHPDCSGYYLLYADCKASDIFINEAFFNVIAIPDAGDGGTSLTETPLISVDSVLIETRPSVVVTAPKDGDLFSSTIPIIYTAADDDDLRSGDNKEKYGLSNTPTTIYYYEVPTNGVKTLIAQNLSAAGTFLWKWVGLLEGKFYKIIVDAFDKAGEFGEAESGFFSIDLTPPTFTVKADPPVVKDEDVTITVEASKELASAPVVSVMQRGTASSTVVMSGSGRVWKGVYHVSKGFDGTAFIGVSGVDITGNNGSTLIGGGTFNINVNPPHSPIILSPVDNEKISTSSIVIRGTAREDTKVTATVNGVDTYSATPNKDGEFLISDVFLKKIITNGLNIISVVAADHADTLSEAAVVRLSLNVAPTVTWLRPAQSTTLTATTTLALDVADENGDKIYLKYEIIPDGLTPPIESEWESFANTPSSLIDFDTREFGDGDYLLRATADDGATTTVSSIIKVRIKNELPFISFDDGRRTTIAGKSTTIRGTVFAPKNISPQPSITRLEYSITNGKKWIAATAADGAFNSSEERFMVTFQNLKEGTNDILWRTTDSRNFVSKSKHPIIVDSTPPRAPKIASPLDGSTLADADNEGGVKGKLSFTLRGYSEPGSNVFVEVAGKKFTGVAAFDGTFRVVGVSLPTRGKYIVQIYATDAALNKSAMTSATLLYDNPPVLVFTNPRDGRGVGLKTSLSWLASDQDGDTITNSILSYRQLGTRFVVLAKDPKQKKFEWDTSTMQEGNNYELQLEASDGLATSTEHVSFSIDHTPPQLSIFDVRQSVYGNGGTFEGFGSANDNGSGIEFIEYRFESANAPGQADFPPTPWYKGTISSGSLGRSAAFSIQNKLALPDGQYNVIARAVDAAGNTSEEKSQTITMDGTPPRVGAFDIESGAMKLIPNDGQLNVVVGTELSLMLSLEKDAKSAFLTVDGKMLPLAKNLATGLWQSDFSLSRIGTSTLFVSATDTFGNSAQNVALVDVAVAQRGKTSYIDEKGLEQPLMGVSMSVFKIDKQSSFWSRWFGGAKAEEVLVSDAVGGYNLLLPAGEYRIVVQKDGFDLQELQDIIFTSPTFVTENFEMSQKIAGQSFIDKILEMLHL